MDQHEISIGTYKNFVDIMSCLGQLVGFVLFCWLMVNKGASSLVASPGFGDSHLSLSVHTRPSNVS